VRVAHPPLMIMVIDDDVNDGVLQSTSLRRVCKETTDIRSIPHQKIVAKVILQRTFYLPDQVITQ
jgi:hypothetical protein